ncbi:LamB/YcsF family protein, partial [Marinobacter confluentis]
AGIQQQASEHGISLLFEAFADRAYDQDGKLVTRSLPGAVHHDTALIIDQATRISEGRPLTASDGSELFLQADTLCVHGDNEESIAAVRRICEVLASTGRTV